MQSNIETFLSTLAILDADGRRAALKKASPENLLALFARIEEAISECRKERPLSTPDFDADLREWRDEIHASLDRAATDARREAAATKATDFLLVQMAKPKRVFLSATVQAHDDVLLVHPHPRGMILGVVGATEYVTAETSALTYCPRAVWDAGLGDLAKAEIAKKTAAVCYAVGERAPAVVFEDLSKAASLETLNGQCKGFDLTNHIWLSNVRCLKTLALWIAGAGGENTQLGSVVADRFRTVDRTGAADVAAFAAWWTAEKAVAA